MLARYTPLQQNADGILLTIMSLQKLTVYFWAQDRFANLMPLLAAWIRDPTANLEAQLFLRLIAGLAAPLFFCALAFRRAIDIWRATILADLLLLIAGRSGVMHEIFVEASPYGLSLALAGLAAMAQDVRTRSRHGAIVRAAGAIGLVVAYLVNVGLITLALPLIGLLALLLPSQHRHRLVILHFAAAGVSFLLPAVVAHNYATRLDLAPSLGRFLHYARVVWDATGASFALAALLPAVLLIAALRWRGRPAAARLAAVLVVVLLAGGVLNPAVVAGSQHLAASAFHIRYFVPGYLLLISIGGGALWALAAGAVRRRNARSAAFLAVSMVLLLTTVRPLSRRGVDNSDLLFPEESALSRAVAARYVALSLDGIAGLYWDVWPAVFMAEQYHSDTLYRGNDVLGVTTRGGVRLDAFAARLAAKGSLRLVCIDRTAAECALQTAGEMGQPPLPAAEFLPAEPLPGDHMLRFVTLSIPSR